jgi:siroheme synthase
LITVRGYHALGKADVVLADRLVSKTFLDDLGIVTEGKLVEWLGDGPPRPTQTTINRRLVEHALAGRTVARLKGGDPFVFGRGDAEIDHLDEHGIPWEVIPGCSSATAALTAAGVPLTRHGKGRSFAVATARVAGGGLAEEFPRADTLVLLMGMGVLDEVVERLLADGWSPDAPAAVVERGTLPWERRVKGPLAQLGRVASEAGIASPALIVVGEGALGVFAAGRRPTVLFTGRDPAHFGELGNLLHWPALDEGPPGDLGRPHPELGRPLPEHDVICFASSAGVRAYWEAYGPAAFRREVWCLNGAAHEVLSRRHVAAQIIDVARAPLGVRVPA